MLLIGCETNAAKIDLEGFVPAFQDAGAVIIVSTIASILAAPRPVPPPRLSPRSSKSARASRMPPSAR